MNTLDPTTEARLQGILGALHIVDKHGWVDVDEKFVLNLLMDDDLELTPTEQSIVLDWWSTE